MTDLPRFVGRYQVERLIAHGGMGSLYLARDPAIGRLVVIKVLKAGFDDAAARERFALEARAAGRLHHPNIVTVFDVGEHDDRPFIAMEYVAGETLAQLVGRRAAGPVWGRIGILEDLCAGLHYAHCASIVHRDIKPANVMLDQSGVVKILDFGIARGGGGRITRAGDIVGTLNYMSPEQLAGGPVDHRTDVYSVGAVAYELITGHMAFPGTIQTGVLFNILNSSPVPIESLVPGTDPDIAATIGRAMAREPGERYPDLEIMRQDLAAVRTRLLDAAPDAEALGDPNAETRFESPRISSDIRSRPASSRVGSARKTGAGLIVEPPEEPVTVAARRRHKGTLPLLVVCATIALALTSILVFDWFRGNTTVGSDSTSPEEAQPPPASPVEPPRAPADERNAGRRSENDEAVSAARTAARQQIAGGQRQRALETLTRGLALDAQDPELNALVEELATAARRLAAEGRAAAVARGAGVRSSTAFRDGQARENEAERLLGAGDRVEGIRAALTAAALYNKAPEASTQTMSAPPAQPPVTNTDPRIRPPASTQGDQPVTTPPSVEGLKPGPPAKPAGTPLPRPTAPQPEAAPVSRDAPADPHTVDLAAIRETLRRYTEAYQSLNGAAVGKLMPSLTARQLRDLDRDFANYRSYTVAIKDERIALEGATATVTCDVVRSFETKNGLAGSNTVPTIFHLRRSGAGWAIERLESR